MAQQREADFMPLIQAFRAMEAVRASFEGNPYPPLADNGYLAESREKTLTHKQIVHIIFDYVRRAQTNLNKASLESVALGLKSANQTWEQRDAAFLGLMNWFKEGLTCSQVDDEKTLIHLKQGLEALVANQPFATTREIPRKAQLNIAYRLMITAKVEFLINIGISLVEDDGRGDKFIKQLIKVIDFNLTDKPQAGFDLERLNAHAKAIYPELYEEAPEIQYCKHVVPDMSEKAKLEAKLAELEARDFDDEREALNQYLNDAFTCTPADSRLTEDQEKAPWFYQHLAVDPTKVKLTPTKAKYAHPCFKRVICVLSGHTDRRVKTLNSRYQRQHDEYMKQWLPSYLPMIGSDDSHLLAWNEFIISNMEDEFKKLAALEKEREDLRQKIRELEAKEAEAARPREEDSIERWKQPITLVKALKIAAVIGLVLGIIAAGVYGGMVLFAGAALKAAVTHIMGIAGTYLASQFTMPAGLEIAINVVANLLAPIVAAVLATGFFGGIVTLVTGSGSSVKDAPPQSGGSDEDSATEVPTADPSLAEVSASRESSAQADDGAEEKQDSDEVFVNGEQADSATEPGQGPSDEANPTDQPG